MRGWFQRTVSQTVSPPPLQEGSAAPFQAGSTDGFQTGSTDGSPERSSERSPEASTPVCTAISTAQSLPLTTTRVGDNSVRVVNGKVDWTHEDFAEVFLDWLAMTEPNYRNGWVWYPDIRKHLFKRFKAETGCRHLAFGVLIRGLTGVTHKRDVAFTDITGKRHTTTEYWVGDAIAVVEVAAAERRRA